MADVHVSKTATNGYSVGNDGTADGTKELPYLTGIAAISASSNNDTIILNDGTYDENFTITGKTGLTINPENDYLTTFTNPSTARVILVDNLATGLTLGRIVVDGESNTQSTIECDGTVSVDALTINGTKMINPTQKFIDDGGTVTLKSLTMLGGWICQGTITIHGIAMSPAQNDTVIDISDGTMDVTLNAEQRSGIFCFPGIGITGTSFSVDNVILNVTELGTRALIYGIRTEGADTVDVSNSTITFTDASTSPHAIEVGNNALATSHCHIWDNTVSGDSAGITTLGTALLIGRESSTNQNQISDAKQWGNTITNFDHGSMLGYITNGETFQNTIDSTDNAIVMKGTTTSRCYGNFLTRSSTGSGDAYIQAKQSTMDLISNNTIIMSAGKSNIGLLSLDDTVQSNGTVFSNNIIYSDVTVGKFVKVNGFLTNELEFFNNNFFSTVALPANAWTYNAIEYATAALFDAAVDAAVGGSSASTEFDPDWDSDFKLNSTSNLVAAGVNWWTLGAPAGHDGEPFLTINTDVGHNQSTFSPFHPVNL